MSSPAITLGANAKRKHMSGKGDKQRPTDKQRFDANWDRIFGKPKKDKRKKEG